MADHGEVEYATATGNDYVEHESTYGAFVKSAIVGTLFVINVVLVLAIGGVADHWLIAVGILLLSILSAIYGLASGSNVPGVITLVLGLLALLLTSH